LLLLDFGKYQYHNLLTVELSYCTDPISSHTVRANVMLTFDTTVVVDTSAYGNKRRIVERIVVRRSIRHCRRLHARYSILTSSLSGLQVPPLLPSVA